MFASNIMKKKLMCSIWDVMILTLSVKYWTTYFIQSFSKISACFYILKHFMVMFTKSTLVKDREGLCSMFIMVCRDLKHVYLNKTIIFTKSKGFLFPKPNHGWHSGCELQTLAPNSLKKNAASKHNPSTEAMSICQHNKKVKAVYKNIQYTTS